MKLAAFVTAAAFIGGSSLIAVPAEARNESIVAYESVVTCEANYRQAQYDMKCWSEKLGKEMTIGEFVEAIKSGRVTR